VYSSSLLSSTICFSFQEPLSLLALLTKERFMFCFSMLEFRVRRDPDLEWIFCGSAFVELLSL
jgi:hypothetical protein